MAGRLRDLALIPALLAMGAVFSLTTSDFLTQQNLLNILQQNAVLGIAAIGATFVILSSGIDLSVGSTIGAAGIAASAVMLHAHSIALGVAAGIGAGFLTGSTLGLLIALFDLTPFVVTLAGMFFASGLTVYLTKGETLGPLPFWLDNLVFRKVLGIPVAAIITVALFVLAQIALTRTTWGRRVQLLGANAKAAQISGVDVRFVTWSVYAVAGVFSGIAGVELVASLSAANADTGSPFLLPVIGAVIIGGTSLFGGQGSIARTGMGVLFLAVLINGLSLLGFQVFDQQAVEGAVILLAVALDILLRRKGYVDNA
jgi:ribose/xylose/arabinose/galactoside ABC-type transport system permease subunit